MGGQPEVVNRAVGYGEWAAAGFPTLSVLPSPHQNASAPGRPADVDCSDFDSHDEAQDWFEAYYADSGNIARLDRDNDGLACE